MFLTGSQINNKQFLELDLELGVFPVQFRNWTHVW